MKFWKKKISKHEYQQKRINNQTLNNRLSRSTDVLYKDIITFITLE